MEPVREQLGDYQLLAQLAKGGQSEVYLAARSGPHGFFRPVVIKAIPDDFKGKPKLEALFYQEATLSSRFSHPHVASVHDAKRAGDDHFIVMDYIPGQTVADFAQRAFSSGAGITLEETLVMLVDASRGLDYVHSFEDIDRRTYEIVHCDISPQNLMVTYGGSTRVFDFGISQVVGESGGMKSDLVGGKFAYMSPEQCREEPLDTRSDVFSLGVILYELATGRRLFRRDSPEEVVQAITEEPIAPPSTVADHLDVTIDKVVMKALEREPDDRYQTAGAMEKDLHALLSMRGVQLDEVRSRLGNKVEELFDGERDELASTLRNARQKMSEQVFTPAKEPELDDVAESDSSDDSDAEKAEEAENNDENTTLDKPEQQGPTQRELELEQALAKSRDKTADYRKNAERATEVASALTEEVTTLQNRQKWFVAGLLGLSLMALAIAAMAYLSHGGTLGDSDGSIEVSIADTAGD